jgi:hypothetical protein
MATIISRVTTVAVPAHQAPQPPQTVTITKPGRSYNNVTTHKVRPQEQDSVISQAPLLSAPTYKTDASVALPSYAGEHGYTTIHDLELGDRPVIRNKKVTYVIMAAVCSTTFIIIIIVVAATRKE